MTDSILNTIKELLQSNVDDTDFDTELIVGINTALMGLTDIGVGPDDGFTITGPDETWTQFEPDISKLAMIKSYVHLRVKLLFDPPSSSYVLTAMNDAIKEYEWRLYIRKDNE